MSYKVLIIEDNFEVRDNLEELLDLAGYEVITAINGKEGVLKAKQEMPNIILCDIMMPELDGYGVLHILGRNPETMHIPFLFLSAKAEKIDFRKGMGLGADDYIPKPYDENQLLETIENKLRKFTSLQQSPAPTIESPELEYGHIFEGAEEFKLNEKSIVYETETLVKKCYYLKKGKVRIYITNEGGKEFTTKIISEGECFNIHALLSLATYKDTAISLTDLVVQYVDKEVFLEKIYDTPCLLQNLVKDLSDEVLSKEQQLIELAYNSVKTRVVKSLLLLAEKYDNNNEQVQFTISRSELASMVGTSPETVIRVLSGLKEENILSINQSTIVIEDLHALMRLDK